MRRICIIAENIRSVYNVGSIMRTAEVYGASLLCTGFTPCHGDIQKTAIGAEQVVDWRYCYDTIDAIALIRQEGYRVFALETGGEYLHEHACCHDVFDIAFVVGNEITGVSDEAKNHCDGIVSLRQYGTLKESLNVCIASGIALAMMRYSSVKSIEQ